MKADICDSNTFLHQKREGSSKAMLQITRQVVVTRWAKSSVITRLCYPISSLGPAAGPGNIMTVRSDP